MTLPSAPPLSGLQHVNLPVRDLARATAFYRDVLGLAVHLEEEGMAMVGLGGADVALMESDAPPAKDFHFGWRLRDKDAVLAWKTRLIEAGVVIHHERDDDGYGIYFRDPDGHAIEIYCG